MFDMKTVAGRDRRGYPIQMTAHLQELRALPISERVQLVEDLWDSIAQDATEYALSPEQVGLLDDRLNSLDEDPRSGTSWEVAKQRIIASL